MSVVQSVYRLTQGTENQESNRTLIQPPESNNKASLLTTKLADTDALLWHAYMKACTHARTHAHMHASTHTHTHNGDDFLWSHTCYISLSLSLFLSLSLCVFGSFCICTDRIETGARTDKQTCELSGFNLWEPLQELHPAKYRKD